MQILNTLLPLLVIAGLWLFFLKRSASLGWSAFAQHHPSDAPIGKDGYSCRWLVFQPDSPKGRTAARLTLTAEGVLFSVEVAVFRPFHSPFLLPWNSIQLSKDDNGEPCLRALTKAGSLLAKVDPAAMQALETGKQAHVS